MNKIKSIAIDVGHGGKDPGAVADVYADGAARLADRGRLLEKDLNLRLGAEVFGQALEAGFDAHLLRGGDYDQSLGQRTDLANRLGVDFFCLSIIMGQLLPLLAGPRLFIFLEVRAVSWLPGWFRLPWLGSWGWLTEGLRPVVISMYCGQPGCRLF